MKWTDEIDGEFNGNPCKIRVGYSESAILKLTKMVLSNENDTVLDLFSDSCSTGIACLNTNRKFIGIELDDNYFDIGAERMRNHIKNE